MQLIKGGITIVVLATAAAIYAFLMRKEPDDHNIRLGDEGSIDIESPPPGEAQTAREVADRTRQAMLDGNPVRIEYHSEQSPTKAIDYWCRPVTDRDKQYALRQVSRIRGTTDAMFRLEEQDPIERERRLAELLRVRAMADAASTLIQQGRAFLTRGYIGSLQSDARWHYWNLTVHYKDEGNLVLYAPIDLLEFPEVSQTRERSREINEFARTDRAYRWNNLDYEERKSLFESSNRSKMALQALQAEESTLLGVAPKSRDAAQEDRLRELSKLIAEHQDTIAKVPPLVNPSTLEWEFR